MSGFISIPFNFAGSEPMTLSIFENHLLQRFCERFHHNFESGMDCLRFLASKLQDERLIRIYEKVPIYASVVLYLESEKMFLILQMGTRADPNEIKISTVLYRANESMRLMIQDTDYPYVLPTEGKLRFGKERKYFELKQRESKYFSKLA